MCAGNATAWAGGGLAGIFAGWEGTIVGYIPGTDLPIIDYEPTFSVVDFNAVGMGMPSPGGAGGSGGASGGQQAVNYFNLVLKSTSDTCAGGDRTVEYQLFDSSGSPVTSPNFYVYEVLSSAIADLAKGGPFYGTSYQPSAEGDQFNQFRDVVGAGIGTGSGTQQFGVSRQQPNSMGVPGGHLIMVQGPGSIVPIARNKIQLVQGVPLINGTACPQ
jgi:hypothetical protein